MLNYLTLGYVQNPIKKTATFYSNILSLPAGYYLIVSPLEGHVQMKRWYKFETTVVSDVSKAPDTFIETFHSLLLKSVEKRLRSDVSIGTSLSGGLDSSTVVAFCDRQVSDHYSHKCFTASFENYEKNELSYAERVANQFGLEHFVTVIHPGGTVELMNEVMRYQEEPISSASSLAQFKVFQSAKQNGVTVLLDGQGADEILGGCRKI